MENPDFLKQKYALQNSPEVESAAKRTEAQSGEKVPQKPEEVPESYFETQRRIARERGQGEIEVTDEMRRQHTEVIIADQESTLDNWIDYLSSPDALYPDWLKYWAVRSILGLGGYDKEKKQFTKRDKGTVKPFPDLNREALAYVLDVIEKKHKGEKPNLTAFEAEDKPKFEQLLAGENFGKLYAWAIEKVTPDSVDRLTITEGKWVKYEKESDHMPLVESLQSHGTGWCTAGESTAEAQLKKGDFYVYYSLNQNGEAKIPRVAIRMEDQGIAEVRGIAPEQNLDPYIASVAQEKLKEFPDGEKYEKKVRDMKLLTEIDNRVKRGDELTKDDLIFLYEIKEPIEGFGYQKDPRVEELREARKLRFKDDLVIIFGCKPERVALAPNEIKEDTLVYVGKLEPGIFNRLPVNIEHIYAEFPREIHREKVEIIKREKPSILSDKLKLRLTAADIGMTESAAAIIDDPYFVFDDAESSVYKDIRVTTLIRLTAADLGLKPQIISSRSGVAFDQVYERAKELGLELCPGEVIPYYCIEYRSKLPTVDIRVGMKFEHTSHYGFPSALSFEILNEKDSGMLLSTYSPDNTQSEYSTFLFRLPNRAPSTPPPG